MFFIRLLSRLPFSVLYLISDFCFLIAYHVIRYRRKLVQKNLRNSFPEKPAVEIARIEKEFYRNLCDYAVETLKLLTISREELGRRMQFEHPEVLEGFASKNQSIIFLASHHFNWEWSLVAACFAFPFKIDFVYQPVNNKFFDRLSLALRTRFGAYAIRREDVAREMVKRKNILRGVATVADQYPGYKKDKKFSTEFLHQPTVFFLGTNSMAVLSQYPAVYYSLRKLKRGYYLGTPHVVGMPPYDKNGTTMLENYIREVEKLTKEHPSSWLWSHNRWKKRHLQEQATDT
ncbi:MAG TPA: lysophospholipid acyltransferase family protein [Chryseosolibacter sp.]|nr:lysophospholipid acyltransferase family protein [Chryseosolibacter sp.]